MGVEATETHGMHMDAVDHLPARAAIGFGGIRNRAKTGGLARLRDALGGMERGAGRRVHLVRMMQFDDFGGFEVRCGDLREVVSQNRGDGEVRSDEHALAFARGLGERGTHLVEFLIGPASGADHHVDALPHQCEHIAQRDARHGEFHHHVGVVGGDAREVVTRVEREREFGVGRVGDGLDHVGSHTALGTDDGNLDHCSSLEKSDVPHVFATCPSTNVKRRFDARHSDHVPAIKQTCHQHRAPSIMRGASSSYVMP